MSRLRRYLRLYRIFWENSIAREAEFRANFWANVVANAGWLIFFVAFIKVIYYNTPRIADWTEGEAMVLTGTFGLISGVFQIVAYQNLSRFPEMVRLGTLDFVVTKPVNPQFLVSARYVKLDSFGNVAGAAAVVSYGLLLGAALPTVAGVASYLYLCACGLAIYYSIYLLLLTTAFWFVRVENLAVLADMVFHVGRYPIDIFRGWTRRFFVYVVPIAFIASFPARALFGKLEPHWLGLAALFAVGLLVASSLFWNHGLRSYSSASS